MYVGSSAVRYRTISVTPNSRTTSPITSSTLYRLVIAINDPTTIPVIVDVTFCVVAK